MNPSSTRRSFLLATAALAVAPRGVLWAAGESHAALGARQLEKLEKDFGGRIGLFAFDSANGAQLGHRAHERFPVCSTFKVLAASAILRKSGPIAGLLQRTIKYQQSDLVANSPITKKHVSEGMTVAALCAAAIQYSDNTAGNQLMKILGGPQAVSAFTHSLGDTQFRLDRWETALNTAIPGDPRDTCTPVGMGQNLQHLALGDALTPGQRQQLRLWLLGNTTGATRIKAAIPADWKIGDKTGTGDYGTGNDLAVLWPPKRKPVIVAIYTTQSKKDAAARNDVIQAAARIVVDWLG